MSEGDAGPARSTAADVLTAWGVPGIGEVRPGDDLAVLLGDALVADARERPGTALRDGDVLVVTSKIVSKAEGRVVRAADREAAITAETVRVVATREHAAGVTRIVENRLGLVMAAAGVDASNTEDGTVLLLPEDPDATARSLRAALADRFGVRLGVLISDTAGRPWRQGQTDIAIGAAGVMVLDDLRGSTDTRGRPLQVSIAAVADEIAAAAELVKGKATARPVAVVRGLPNAVTPEDGPGARALLRPTSDDLFPQGTTEAYTRGWHDAMAGRPPAPRSGVCYGNGP